MTYTPRTLVRFDGKDWGWISLAISGTVFVVTAGRGFYDPGRPPELEHDYVPKMVNGKRLNHRVTALRVATNDT